MTDDAEELAYFTEVLKRLDALRERAPKDSLLAEAVAEANESIDGLVQSFRISASMDHAAVSIL